jgi:hypothetical protein
MEDWVKVIYFVHNINIELKKKNIKTHLGDNFKDVFSNGIRSVRTRNINFLVDNDITEKINKYIMR